MWLSEPFTRSQAWIDLLLLANHEYGYFYIRGNKIDVQRGEVARSEEQLALRWKWSRGKLRGFLKALKNEQQIEQQKSKLINKIVIVNYDNYQNSVQQTEQQKADRKPTESRQKDINNNNNNNNNENNIGDLPKWLPIDDWVAFKEMRQEIKKPMSQLAESRMIKKLDRLRNEGYDPARLLDRSIINKWQDVFEDSSCKVKGEFSGMFG